MSEKDLHKEIEKLKAEVAALKKRKKYGLVWEPHDEDVVDECKTKLPVLTEVTKRAINKAPNDPTNIIIEGDNYHALSVLNYTHAGKIDVIYIDPPYNTGAKDWKYNNDYVDDNDTYRHSKWICMMHHRLRLAANLLSRDGILFSAIDDHEFATLKLLLEELLPGYSHETVVVNHHPQGSGGANVSATHEYCIVSVPNGKHLFFGDLVGERTEEWSLIKAGAGRDYYREGRPNMFFAVHVDKKTGIAVGIGPDLGSSNDYPISDTSDGYKRVYPLDRNDGERRWRYGRSTMLDLIKKGRIKGSVPNYSMKVIMPRNESFKPLYSNWTDSKYNAGPHGTSLLRTILPDTNFQYPKSIYTVLDFVAGATRLNKNSTILDFFAGSGTTGHAVMKLNQEDGGKRQFILCTNNENKIAEEVTYPRIKKVIEGYADEKGIPANVRYFKTDFVKKDQASDDTRRALVERSTDMICVRENTFESKFDNASYKIFTNGKIVTGILFNLKKMDEFKAKIDKLALPAHLYVFSISNDAYEDDFDDLAVKHKIVPIPESILEVYRKLFKRL